MPGSRRLSRAGVGGEGLQLRPFNQGDGAAQGADSPAEDPSRAPRAWSRVRPPPRGHSRCPQSAPNALKPSGHPLDLGQEADTARLRLSEITKWNLLGKSMQGGGERPEPAAGSHPPYRHRRRPEARGPGRPRPGPAGASPRAAAGPQPRRTRGAARTPFPSRPFAFTRSAVTAPARAPLKGHTRQPPL